MNTKERILTESLKLFSVFGYDAVSIRQIAQQVGVTNSALYKHYKSKQAILDAILEQAKAHFIEKSQHSIESLKENFDLQGMCLSMYQFQTEDEWMVMIRRLLVMEQFKNKEMAQMYQAFFIRCPLKAMTEYFRELIGKRCLKEGNPEVMALELYAPFFMFHMAKKENLEELFTEYVKNFEKQYFIR